MSTSFAPAASLPSAITDKEGHAFLLETAAGAAGIVVNEGRSYRFFSAQDAFRRLEGSTFATPSAAQKAVDGLHAEIRAKATRKRRRPLSPWHPVAALILALTAFARPSLAADNVESFYKGKTVSIVVGAEAGTGYDIRARVLARHFGDHIPGDPTVLVQNMPAAAFLAAANWLYNAAPRDGATLGAVSYTLPIQPLIAATTREKSNYRFDALKFNWIGSIEQEPSIGFCRNESDVKSFEQAFAQSAIVAASTPQSNSVIFPTVFNNLLGTKFKIVHGYQGTKAPFLALERGEVDCHFTSYGTVKVINPQWLEPDGSPIKVLVVVGTQRPAGLAATPLILDYAKTDEQKQVLELLLAPQAMARPYLTTPGVPSERVDALRRAFDATVADPKFVAEAQRVGIEVGPLTGEAVEQLLKDLYKSSPHTVELLRQAMPAAGGA
jgi:tripartite-type tricarboxylate transporter receptor subunit TctC